jgi:hypothetical protein
MPSGFECNFLKKCRLCSLLVSGNHTAVNEALSVVF